MAPLQDIVVGRIQKVHNLMSQIFSYQSAGIFPLIQGCMQLALAEQRSELTREFIELLKSEAERHKENLHDQVGATDQPQSITKIPGTILTNHRPCLPHGMA